MSPYRQALDWYERLLNNLGKVLLYNNPSFTQEYLQSIQNLQQAMTDLRARTLDPDEQYSLDYRLGQLRSLKQQVLG